MQAAVALKLYRTGIYCSYRLFFLFLMAGIVRSIMLLGFDPTADVTYRYIWLCTEPMLLATQAGFAAEIFLKTTTYRRIAQDRLWLFTVLGCGVVAVCLATSLFLVPESSNWNAVFRTILVARRYTLSALAAFLVLFTLFFEVFRVPGSGNLSVHRRIAALYLGGLGAAQTVMTMLPYSGAAVVGSNIGSLAVSILCFGLWVRLLTRSGELASEWPVLTAAEAQNLEARGDALVARVAHLRNQA